MKLCDNCLDDEDVRPFPLGHDRGTQRDPWRAEVELCKPCRALLGETTTGDAPGTPNLPGFHGRFLGRKDLDRPVPT